jgi:hypothetical protein
MGIPDSRPLREKRNDTPMKCPQCGKEAWGGYEVERWNKKSIPPKRYVYLEYNHYAGSKKTITLKALEEILKSRRIDTLKGSILEEAKERAGSRIVRHYGKLTTSNLAEERKD